MQSIRKGRHTQGIHNEGVRYLEATEVRKPRIKGLEACGTKVEWEL